MSKVNDSLIGRLKYYNDLASRPNTCVLMDHAKEILQLANDIMGDASNRKTEASLHHRPDESVQQCANTSPASYSEKSLQPDKLASCEISYNKEEICEKVAGAIRYLYGGSNTDSIYNAHSIFNIFEPYLRAPAPVMSKDTLEKCARVACGVYWDDHTVMQEQPREIYIERTWFDFKKDVKAVLDATGVKYE